MTDTTASGGSTGSGHGAAAEHIIVVGAGIVGASIAYHLAASGGRVTLIDAGLPGEGGTGESFGWVGRPPKPARPSHPLRALAQSEFRRLESELPGLEIQWEGSLIWDGFSESPDPELETARAGTLEPRLRRPPHTAFHSPGDAAIDPLLVTRRLVAAAVEHGAELRTGTPVTGIAREAGRVSGVETAGGLIRGAFVVLAAGAGSAALCPPLREDPVILSSPAVLARLRTAPGLVRGIVGTGDFELRQHADGTLWAPRDYEGETTAEDFALTAQAAANDALAYFDATDPIEPISAGVGWRPMIADGEPLIGPHPKLAGLSLAVMHQGVTLAAAVGRLFAAELISGAAAPEFADCRPSRFLVAHEA